jgi:hypothetical protein
MGRGMRRVFNTSRVTTGAFSPKRGFPTKYTKRTKRNSTLVPSVPLSQAPTRTRGTGESGQWKTEREQELFIMQTLTFLPNRQSQIADVPSVPLSHPPTHNRSQDRPTAEDAEDAEGDQGLLSSSEHETPTTINEQPTTNKSLSPPSWSGYRHDLSNSRFSKNSVTL